jgi:hypothetical protein
MTRQIDPQDARIVGARLLERPDRYLLDGCEAELGLIVARADPELFREIIEDRD